MKYWDSYTASIKKKCSGPAQDEDSLAYWRNDLFAGIIIYLLPLCLIALVPGLYWSFVSGLYVLFFVDILVVTGIMMTAFLPGLSIAVRKIIFVACIFTLSNVLLYYLGISGPGLLYLLSACIFSILIFPARYAFWSAWLNLFICFSFALLIGAGFVSWPHVNNQLLGEWIAVSSNVVFLGFLSSALIPKIFNGLQETIEKEKKLKETLDQRQRSLQEAMDMLEQKNNELEQFAYVASHDLNEPLRMIISFMSLLSTKYGPNLDEKAHSYISFAVDGGKRMQKMIGDLLELSRTGRQDAPKEIVDSREMLEEVKQNIFKLIEETRAEIITTTALPTVTFSRSDITRLMQNLVTNAIKFRKKEINPLIQLYATEKETAWQFSIRDNGIGIREDKLESVFEVFTRLHSKEQYEGTGIGLAICKKIIEQGGGKIWATSKEGEGSTFHFLVKK